MEYFNSGNSYAFVIVDTFDELIDNLDEAYLTKAEQEIRRLLADDVFSRFTIVSRGLLHTDSSIADARLADLPTSYIAWLLGNPKLSRSELSKSEWRAIDAIVGKLSPDGPRLGFAWSHRSRMISALDTPPDTFLNEIVEYASENYAGWHINTLKEVDFFGSNRLRSLVAQIGPSVPSSEGIVQAFFPHSTESGAKIISSGVRMTVASLAEGTDSNDEGGEAGSGDGGQGQGARC